MTPAEKFLFWLTQSWRLDVWIIAKGAVLLLLFLYILFSLVVMKQIKLMSRAINGLAEGWLVWGARGLLVLAISAFLLALFIL